MDVDFKVKDLCRDCYGSGIVGGTASCCGCLLEPGAWGLGGHHHCRRAVQELLWWACIDWARGDPHALSSLRAYSAGNPSPSDTTTVERLREDVWKAKSALIKAAAGVPWAFERCSAYRAKTAQLVSEGVRSSRAGDVGF